LSALRCSLRRRRRARSLRSVPDPAPVLSPRAGRVSVPRRRPALPARAEVWGPPSNRVGPRPSRGPFVGRFGGAPRGLRGRSRTPLAGPEAGARLQPGGAGRPGGGPRGGLTPQSQSLEKDERTTAAGGAVRGRAPDERRFGVPRALAALSKRQDAPPRRRRAHDGGHGGSGGASAPRCGSGSGRRSHPRAGSVRAPRSVWLERPRASSTITLFELPWRLR